MRDIQKKLFGVELYKRAPGESPFFGDQLGNHFRYDSYCLRTEKTGPLLLKSLFVPRRLSKYDIVITSEYFSSFGINLRLLLTRCKTKHLIIGLNQSRSLLKTGLRWLDAIIDFAFQRADLIVVYSRYEADLFSKIHGIPSSRFCFSPWGCDLQPISPTRFTNWPKPYVCLVGRNNRDIDTFIAAVAKTRLDGIIVTSAQHVPPRQITAKYSCFL